MQKRQITLVVGNAVGVQIYKENYVGFWKKVGAEHAAVEGEWRSLEAEKQKGQARDEQLATMQVFW